MKFMPLLSGGLDSTVLATHLVASYGIENVLAVSFNYGQRHVKELEAATQVATYLGIEHVIFDIRTPFQIIQKVSQSSLLFGEDVPHGLYDEMNMKSTIVPNRNMIMASLAVGLGDAYALKDSSYTNIHLATHRGDHAVYPDCTVPFNQAMSKAIDIATESRVRVYMPFDHMSKADIVKRGFILGAPMHLSWSCYEGGDVHCHLCGTCTERAEAFILAGVEDPTQYNPDNEEAWQESLLELKARWGKNV